MAQLVAPSQLMDVKTCVANDQSRINKRLPKDLRLCLHNVYTSYEVDMDIFKCRQKIYENNRTWKYETYNNYHGINLFIYASNIYNGIKNAFSINKYSIEEVNDILRKTYYHCVGGYICHDTELCKSLIGIATHLVLQNLDKCTIDFNHPENWPLELVQIGQYQSLLHRKIRVTNSCIMSCVVLISDYLNLDLEKIYRSEYLVELNKKKKSPKIEYETKIKLQKIKQKEKEERDKKNKKNKKTKNV